MSYGNRDKDQALVAQLNQLVSDADAKLKEATEFAKLHGLEFNWEGPAYGMGGYFDPERKETNYGDESDGWQASSQSC